MEAWFGGVLQEFSDYLCRWDRLLELYRPVAEEQYLVIEEKLKRVFEESTPRILRDLDQAGFSLKAVPNAYAELIGRTQRQLAA
jgi:hypothetical protein